jgi:hypothetical protein
MALEKALRAEAGGVDWMRRRIFAIMSSEA